MPKYRLFAVMELGSTEIRLKIAQFSAKEGVRIIESLKYNISAGSEVYSGGRLSYTLIDEICRAALECMKIVDSYGVQYFKCYATTAFREAKNSEYFIDQAFIRCGLKVEIISNEEEIFLHNKALALNFPGFDDMIEDGAVIVDVNSGNTQFSYYSASKLSFSRSLPIGSLRVLEMLSSQQNKTVAFTGLLEEYIKARINNYKKSIFKTGSYKYMVLLGAHMDIIKRISGASGEKLELSELERAYKIIKDRTPQSISDEYRISYEEAELLLPTVLIHKKFAESAQGCAIIPAEVSLADGMCVEYIEKNAYAHTKHIFTADIISSAKYYASKYDIDEGHCERMIEFSQCVFNSLTKKFGLSKKDMLYLEVAAIFADTGRYINVSEYNRLSYHIASSNPIIGVPTRGHEIISYITLFQNGICENEAFNYMPKSRKLLISKLAAILSLVQALDFKYDGNVKKIRASVKNDRLIITADAKNDITIEKVALKNRAEFFEDVFGLKPELNKGVVH